MAANVRLLGLIAFVGFVAVGIASIQASTDPASLSIGGLAFGAAALVIIVAIFSLLLNLEPRSLVLRLAVRRAREDKGVTVFVTYVIGLLGVTGVALSILLTSTYAAFNSGSVSIVPKDQIVLMPELANDQANADLSRIFRKALQLKPPIIENSADQGSDRGDGATGVVNTPEDVGAVTGAPITDEDRRVLLDGGALTSHPVPSKLTVFSPQPGFAGAKLISRHLVGANPSFARWDSVILTTTALKLGLHPVVPAYVFTDTTPVQRSHVSSIVEKLSIQQNWVQTFRTPDVALPPTAFVVVTGLLVGLTALVAYFVAIMDARGLLQSVITLLTLGVRRRAVGGVLIAKTVLVVISATLAGLMASFIGSAVAFSFGHLKVPLIVPYPEVSLQAVITICVSTFAAAWSIRRARLPRASNGQPPSRRSSTRRRQSVSS